MHYCRSTQTLTTLRLRGNNITSKGVQHLAEALHNNTVRKLIFSWTAYGLLLINIDTHHSLSCVEQHQCWRCTISRSRIAKQCSKTSDLPIRCMCTAKNQYRHSSLWSCGTTILMIKVRMISLKHCITIQ